MKAKNLKVGLKVCIVGLEHGYNFLYGCTKSFSVGNEFFIMGWDEEGVLLSIEQYGSESIPYVWPRKCLKIVKD